MKLGSSLGQTGSCVLGAAVLLSLSCGGAVQPPPTNGGVVTSGHAPVDSAEANWCKAVQNAYPPGESGWKCAWPPGSHVIGEYGRDEWNLDSGALDKCFEPEDQTLAKFRNSAFDQSLGDIQINEEITKKITAGAGLRLTELNLGAWVPDVTISAERDVELVIKFSIKNYSVQKYADFGTAFLQSSASRDACKGTLCGPTTRIIRAAIVGLPVVTIQFKNNTSADLKVGWNVAGVNGGTKNLAGGGMEVSNFKEKVTVAYKVGPSTEMMSAAHVCDTKWNSACAAGNQAHYKEPACADYYYAPKKSRDRCYAEIDNRRSDEIVPALAKDLELTEACWMCKTPRCLDRTSCKIADHYDAEAYACLSKDAKISCADALAAKGSNVSLDRNDLEYIRLFYEKILKQACPPK